MPPSAVGAVRRQRDSAANTKMGGGRIVYAAVGAYYIATRGRQFRPTITAVQRLSGVFATTVQTVQAISSMLQSPPQNEELTSVTAPNTMMLNPDLVRRGFNVLRTGLADPALSGYIKS